jgi:hypothetical protein
MTNSKLSTNAFIALTKGTTQIMTKRLFVALALLCGMTYAQVSVTPVSVPYQTFFDNSGIACALCSLYSYSAGTSTPLATYTDSTGGTQNPNPIVLNAAGGAIIWPDSTKAYKFVLVSVTGATIWTVDNVKSNSGALPCISPYAVQFANSSGNAFACDSTITINPTSHALMVGGAISGPSFSLRNLSTIPSSWTLDVTTPATALASFGAIPLANMASQAADTVVMNATGSSAAPTAVGMPSGCTTGVNYNTATHTWNCTSSTISLGNIVSQGADTVVMNATGASASPTAVAMPAGCAHGDNYDTSTHTWTCVSVPTNIQAADSPGCTTGTSSYNTCTTTVNWPVAFADTNYEVTCTGLFPNIDGSGSIGRTKLVGVVTKTTSAVAVATGNDGTSSNVGFATISCIAVHP